MPEPETHSKYYDSTKVEDGLTFDKLIAALIAFRPDLYAYSDVPDVFEVDLDELIVDNINTGDLHLTYTDEAGNTYEKDMPRCGNYTVYKFKGGPEALKGQAPITINGCIIKDDDGTQKLGIYITDKHGHTYSGASDDQDKKVWTDVSAGLDTQGVTHFWKSETQPTEDEVDPENPGLNFWVDLSDPKHPQIKVPIEGTDEEGNPKIDWIPLSYPNMMSSEVYDPEGHKTSIFGYLAEKLEPFNHDYAQYIRHITNELPLKHLTKAQVAQYNDAVTTDNLQSMIEEAKTTIAESVHGIYEEYTGADEIEKKWNDEGKSYWKRHIEGDDAVISLDVNLGETSRPSNQFYYTIGETVSFMLSMTNGGNRDLTKLHPKYQINQDEIKELEIVQFLSRNDENKTFTFTHQITDGDTKFGGYLQVAAWVENDDEEVLGSDTGTFMIAAQGSQPEQFYYGSRITSTPTRGENYKPKDTVTAVLNVANNTPVDFTKFSITGGDGVTVTGGEESPLTLGGTRQVTLSYQIPEKTEEEVVPPSPQEGEDMADAADAADEEPGVDDSPIKDVFFTYTISATYETDSSLPVEPVEMAEDPVAGSDEDIESGDGGGSSGGDSGADGGGDAGGGDDGGDDGPTDPPAKIPHTVTKEGLIQFTVDYSTGEVSNVIFKAIDMPEMLAIDDEASPDGEGPEEPEPKPEPEPEPEEPKPLEWPAEFDPHVTSAQYAYWDAKSPVQHSHAASDHRVKVSASDIEGGIFNRERLPREIKERVFDITGLEVLQSAKMDDTTPDEHGILNKEKFHVGNILHIPPTNPGGYKEDGNEDTGRWYKVVDTTVIGTEKYQDAVVEFTNQIEKDQKFYWSTVQDKPNSIEGYGIEDLTPRSEIDESVTELKSEMEPLASTLAGLLEEAIYDLPQDGLLAKKNEDGTYSWLNENCDGVYFGITTEADNHRTVHLMEKLKESTPEDVKPAIYVSTDTSGLHGIDAGLLWNKVDQLDEPDTTNVYSIKQLTWPDSVTLNSFPQDITEEKIKTSKFYPTVDLLPAPNAFQLLLTIVVDGTVCTFAAEPDLSTCYYIGDEPINRLICLENTYVLHCTGKVFVCTAGEDNAWTTWKEAKDSESSIVVDYLLPDPLTPNELVGLHVVPGVEEGPSKLQVTYYSVSSVSGELTRDTYREENETPPGENLTMEGDILFAYFNGTYTFIFTDSKIYITDLMEVIFSTDLENSDNKIKVENADNYKVVDFAFLDSDVIYLASVTPYTVSEDSEEPVAGEPVDVLCLGTVVVDEENETVTFTKDDEFIIDGLKLLDLLPTSDEKFIIGRAIGQNSSDPQVGQITPVFISIDPETYKLKVDIEHTLRNDVLDYDRVVSGTPHQTYMLHDYSDEEGNHHSTFLVCGPITPAEQEPGYPSCDLYFAYRGEYVDEFEDYIKDFGYLPYACQSFVADNQVQKVKWQLVPNDSDEYYHIGLVMPYLTALHISKNEADRWDGVLDIDEVTADMAKFREAFPSPPVAYTWENYNGDVLYTAEAPKGDPVPEYAGEYPPHEARELIRYTFDHWNELRRADGLVVTFRAVFTETELVRVEWHDYDGSLLGSGEMAKDGSDTIPSPQPGPGPEPEDEWTTVTFHGWYKNATDDCITYTAQYLKKYAKYTYEMSTISTQYRDAEESGKEWLPGPDEVVRKTEETEIKFDFIDLNPHPVIQPEYYDIPARNELVNSIDRYWPRVEIHDDKWALRIDDQMPQFKTNRSYGVLSSTPLSMDNIDIKVLVYGDDTKNTVFVESGTYTSCDPSVYYTDIWEVRGGWSMSSLPDPDNPSVQINTSCKFYVYHWQQRANSPAYTINDDAQTVYLPDKISDGVKNEDQNYYKYISEDVHEEIIPSFI